LRAVELLVLRQRGIGIAEEGVVVIFFYMKLQVFARLDHVAQSVVYGFLFNYGIHIFEGDIVMVIATGEAKKKKNGPFHVNLTIGMH
jgi:hypothetical protein